MAAAGGGSSRMKWITDLEKTVLLSNFEKRGWMRGSSEGRVFCDLEVASQLRHPLLNISFSLQMVTGTFTGMFTV